MKPAPSYSAKVSVAVALSVFCSACTPGQKSSKTEDTKSPPPYDSVLEFKSAQPSLEEDYKATDKEGCPAFPEESRHTVFGPKYQFRHNTWNTKNTGSLHCVLLTKVPPGVIPADPFHLTITRSPTGTRDTARRGYMYFRHFDPLLRRQELTFLNKYPGFGFATESLAFRWQCGPYRLRLWSNLTYHIQDRLLAEDMLQALEFQTKDLCGTVESPSAQVMNDPYTNWAIFDTFGGGSPTDYGVSRPLDVKPLKRRQLVRPLTFPSR